MSVAEELGRELGASGRCIRRAFNDGLIRGQRPSPKKLVVSARERLYLRDYWELLFTIRRALRTEPAVSLAVVYGSVARGDADPDSDIDLLVELKRDDPRVAADLRRRLERASGREVGLARLPRVDSDAPLLLTEILAEGRVLVDRADRWQELQSQRASIERRAQVAYAEQMRATREALERIERPGGMKHGATRAEIARMGKRLRNVDTQLTALDLAISEVSDDRLDGPEWERAFVSGDPHDINGVVNPIVGGYEHVVQNMIELAKAASRVTGKLEGRRPRAEDAIAFLGQAGAISPRDKERLDQLYVFRGRVSHESPDITADDVALHAERALVELPPMIKSIRRWLADQDIEFA